MAGVSGIASGTLPDGTQYGNALNNVGANGLVIGAGELYMMSTANMTSIPPDTEIEIDSNNVGNINGGFKINSKPKLESVENQYGQIISNYVIREEFSAKTGLVTWNLDNFSKLSTATTYTTETDKRSVWTGKTNQLPIVLIRFVSQVQKDGSVIRFTMVGQGGKGFGLEFGTKPVTFDAEIEAVAFFKNFLAEIRVTKPQGSQSVVPPSQPNQSIPS